MSFSRTLVAMGLLALVTGCTTTPRCGGTASATEPSAIKRTDEISALVRQLESSGLLISGVDDAGTVFFVPQTICHGPTKPTTVDEAIKKMKEKRSFKADECAPPPIVIESACMTH
jgi:hypothetical protein